MKRVLSIPGDGIGKEVIPAAERVLRRLAPDIEIERANAGFETFVETGNALPEETLQAALGADAVLFGAVGSPLTPTPGYRSPIVALRRALDLYGNLRPTAGSRANLLIVRENTEGLYSGRESLSEDGETAIAERVITRRGSERIVRLAFEEARRRGFGKVTLVHKANVLRVTDGLFRETALGVARDFPDIGVDEMLVDTAAMHLAANPERFQVVVTTNLFGDILSDVACIHGGGLGTATSANVGDGRALFEPVHGSAPDIAGTGVANPMAAFGCVEMLLRWLGRDVDANRLAEAMSEACRQAPGTTAAWEEAVLASLPVVATA